MKVKLIDVANRAGVSKSTASQYINGRYEYMSKDTKKRIQAAIEELDYTPNQIARSLKTRKTNSIAVIVNSISGHITSQVIRGIDDYCKEKNFNVLIYNTDYDSETEKKALCNLKSFGIDGVIITSSGEITELLYDINQNSFPVVHIHRKFEGMKLNTVLSNYYQGTFDATNYLVKQGHKQIAIITYAFEGITTRQDRIDGYIDSLKKHNIKLDSELVKIVDNPNETQSAIHMLLNLETPPTCIITMYNNLTVQLLNYVNQHNIKIPDDLSIVAFDDLPHSNLFKVPITVINQSSYELGQKSAELIINRISNPNKEHDNVTLPCELIIRESTNIKAED